MDILKISHVAKTFGTKNVLNDLSFSVPEHSVFGFIGQNGAGKTTTMKIVLGLLESDQGEIFVNGEKVAFGQNNTNKYIGYLPDGPEFYDFMTPLEYLTMCGQITGMSKKEIKEKSKELLTLVGLNMDHKRIKGFSRGMKQRLGIAQALLNCSRGREAEKSISVSAYESFEEGKQKYRRVRCTSERDGNEASADSSEFRGSCDSDKCKLRAFCNEI